MPPNEEKRFVQDIREAMTFPFITRELNGDVAGGDPGRALAGGSLNQVAQQTLRRVLGWRYRDGDTKGFDSALSKAFTPRSVEGHVEWDWKPQAFTLQADLGEITGAQASIHSQASLMLEQSITLLDGLEPLIVDADEEDTEAIRSIIRNELQTLIDELGLRGGPRVRRVDLIFKQLATSQPNADPALVGGQLGELRRRFGLLTQRVNTIAEEQNLTNYMILVDYVLSLQKTWELKRDHFVTSGSSPYLGTHLVRMSKDLEVIVEDVHEAYALMDSVLFGAAEREATLLDLRDDTRMTIAELLGWAESFASSEGPELLRTSGRDGASAFADTADTLHDLVDSLFDLLETSDDDAPSVPRGLRTPRVRAAIQDIVRCLKEVASLAKQIARHDAPGGHHPHDGGNGHDPNHGGTPSPPPPAPSSARAYAERWAREAGGLKIVEVDRPLTEEITLAEDGTFHISLDREYPKLKAAKVLAGGLVITELASVGKHDFSAGTSVTRLKFERLRSENPDEKCDLVFADRHTIYFAPNCLVFKG